MKPSEDDLTHRQQASRGKSAKVPISNQRKGGQSSIFKRVLLVLMLCVISAAAGGSWYVWQQLSDMQRLLDNSTKAIGASGALLNDLESAVSTQHQSLTSEGGKRSQELKAINNEIRKLWDISNKRNKSNIKANKANVAALTQTVDKYKKQLTTLTQSIKGRDTTIDSIEQRLMKSTSASDLLADSFSQFKVAMDVFQNENQHLKKKIFEQGQRIDTIKLGGLSQQLADVEESIVAIDAHRRQLNGRLDQLNKEVQALYLPKQ